MRERRIQGSGVSLAATGSGDPDNPTIVFVHGFPDTASVWRPIIERLSARYHAVAYDVRGAGSSTALQRTEDYRMDRLVDDLRAVLDAASPERPVHLVGHDWGSIQSWEAVCHPMLTGRISSFTSISGPALDHAGAWIRARLRRPTPRAIRQLIHQGTRSWYVTAFRLPGAERAWRRNAHRYARFLQRREGVRTTPDFPAPTLAEDATHGMNLYRANMPDRLRNPRPRRTDVPVQLIVPLRDHYVSPALLDGIERIAPKLWRRDIDAGHWAPRTHPDLVARLIEEFVDYVEGGTEPPSLVRARVGARPSHAGRVVVVTGAGSGIGRETALAFAEHGAQIVAADIDPEGAARTAGLARLLGVAAHPYHVDVGDTDAMETFAKWVEHEIGTPDVVVNNAGIGMGGPVLDTEVADWERVLHVNLWGVIHGCRLFGRQMVARGEGGHIVNIASGAAFSPGRAFPAYATTKAAVLMLSESLRTELAPNRIGVTAICPGIVDTGIVTRTRFVGTGDEEQQRTRDAIQRLYRRRRFTPDKVATAIVRAVERDEAVVPVGPEAHLARFVYRLSPGLARKIGSVDIASRTSSRRKLKTRSSESNHSP